jgi:hypothetical protein
MKTATDIEHDLAVVREFILDLSEQEQGLRKALMPYWGMRKDLRQQIIETYPMRGNHPVFSFAGKEDRRIMYNELLSLAEEWGEVAGQHRDVKADLEAAVRERKRLVLRLDSMQKAGRLF